MSSTSPAPRGFSLFPSPATSNPPASLGQPPRGRRSESRERRAQTPQESRIRTPGPGEQSQATSPPRTAGRRTPQQIQTTQYQQQTPPQMQLPQQQQQQPQHPGSREQTPLATEQPQAQHPLQQHPSTHIRDPDYRSSIAKLPLDDESGPSTQLRSIFPTYNPDLPLGQQNYAPTQLSPTRIPKAVISRQSYFPNDDAEGLNQEPQVQAQAQTQAQVQAQVQAQFQARSPPMRSPDDDPRLGHILPVPKEPPVEPQTCTTNQLKSFWRVANGWKASPSEGRVYCLKLSQEKDAPVYTLSSQTQPFYNIRIDPTSASAYVTVSRHDPNKPYKDPTADSGSSSSLLSAVSSSANSNNRASKITDGKHWQEALTTTLEEESRRHQPEDGLVALLMPRAAAKMAVEKSDDPQALYTAEMECARLVWDDDSASHFLVHPALATPFCVTIERSPAWSRVEYTLEHHESPKHLAKLTRDGTGGGWLEVDTGLASKIESFYLVDVAVTALLLVASADEKNQPAAALENSFEPPPMPPQTLFLKPESGRDSGLAKVLGGGTRKKDRKDKKRTPMESFEMDLESQSSSLGKSKRKDTKVKEGLDKLPFLLRAPAKLARWAFKALIWILTQLFSCLRSMFCCCYGVVGSKY